MSSFTELTGYPRLTGVAQLPIVPLLWKKSNPPIPTLPFVEKMSDMDDSW
jgi:hypothetical protein